MRSAGPAGTALLLSDFQRSGAVCVRATSRIAAAAPCSRSTFAICDSSSRICFCCSAVGAGITGAAFVTRPSSPISGTLLKNAIEPVMIASA